MPETNRSAPVLSAKDAQMSDLNPLKSASDTLAAGRQVQNGRIRVISENLANAESTAETAGGTPYGRRIAVFRPVVPDDPTDPKGRIVRDTTGFRTRFDPGHVAADKRGYVKLPNVNPAVESADLQAAIRHYELNLSASASIDSVNHATIDLLK